MVVSNGKAENGTTKDTKVHEASSTAGFLRDLRALRGLPGKNGHQPGFDAKVTARRILTP